MKTAKKNSIVYVRAFEGYPLARCTLKGRYYDSWHGCYYYVVKPLETVHGYYRGQIDTCREIIPAGCFRWKKSSFRWEYKSFEIDENLPVINDLDKVK
jgi:hypothetical protein